jgi:hypothetical protein
LYEACRHFQMSLDLGPFTSFIVTTIHTKCGCRSDNQNKDSSAMIFFCKQPSFGGSKLHSVCGRACRLAGGAQSRLGNTNKYSCQSVILTSKTFLFKPRHTFIRCEMYNTMIVTSAVLNNPNRNFTFLHHLGIFNFDLAPPLSHFSFLFFRFPFTRIGLLCPFFKQCNHTFSICVSLFIKRRIMSILLSQQWCTSIVWTLLTTSLCHLLSAILKNATLLGHIFHFQTPDH